MKNITIAGLARIKTREFLLMMQQLPQHSWDAILFLAMALCTDENGVFPIPEKDELRDFLGSHQEQLLELMSEVEDDVLALPNSMWN
jgi:hypothetical protein